MLVESLLLSCFVVFICPDTSFVESLGFFCDKKKSLGRDKCQVSVMSYVKAYRADYKYTIFPTFKYIRTLYQVESLITSVLL